MKSSKLAPANSKGVEHLHIMNENPAVARELKQSCEMAGNYNPLLHGMKNVGRNIGVEMAAGKPRKQAIAIAYSVARGKKNYH